MSTPVQSQKDPEPAPGPSRRAESPLKSQPCASPALLSPATDATLADIEAAQPTGAEELQYNFEWHTDPDEWEKLPRGMARLAARQTCYPDGRMYRRFARLYNRMLLVMQRNLQGLYEELHALDTAESLANESNAIQERDRTRTQIEELLQRLAPQLIEYGKTFAAHQTLEALPQTPMKAHRRHYAAMRRMGMTEEECKLMAVPDDIGSLGLVDITALLEHKWIKKPFEDHNGEVDAEMVGRVIKIVVVFVIGTALLVPIAILYLGNLNRPASFGLVFAFLFVLMAILYFVPGVSFHAVLVGISAYMAVLVTFLGNMLQIDAAR